MPNLETISQFFQDHWVAITVVNLAFSLIFIIIVAIAFGALPKDYWQHRGDEKYNSSALKIIRNILSLPFFVAGFLMLFLPGQGVLTVLRGLLVSDFSYKRKLIVKIISKEKVRNSLDALRKKMGKETFDWPLDSKSAN